MPTKKGPPAKQKSFKIPLEMADKIEWLAMKRGLSETDIVKFALDSYLDSAIKKYGESKDTIEELKY